MERISRKVVTEMGSTGLTCKAPRTGKEVKDHAILHSVTKALRIGNTVHEARRVHADPIDAVVMQENGVLLFKGKIADMTRRTIGGFLRGATRIEGLDGFSSEDMQLEFQNEFSVACRVGDRGDQFRRNRGAINFLKMALDIAG